MKTVYAILGLLCLAAVLSACQASTGGDTTGETALSTLPDDLPPFYQATDTNEAEPPFFMYIDPVSGNLTPTVDVNCYDMDFEQAALTNGSPVANHCILETGIAVVHLVLPNGTMLGVAPQSLLQVNQGDTSSEVLVQRGQVDVFIIPGSGNQVVVGVGDAYIEADGTIFAVRLHDQLINVFINEGTVHTHRCAEYADYGCKTWGPDIVTMESEQGVGTQYNGMVGRTKWQKADSYSSQEPDVLLELLDDDTKLSDRYSINPTTPDLAVKSLSDARKWANALVIFNLAETNVGIPESEVNVQAARLQMENPGVYCKTFPMSSACIIETASSGSTGGSKDSSTGGSAGGSIGGTTSGSFCPSVPSFITVDYCDCGHTNTIDFPDGTATAVYCYYRDGDGWIPQCWAQANGLCP